VLISFITFLISGLVQILNRQQSMFIKDCDQRIELMKLELKARFNEQNNEEVATPNQDQGGEPADYEPRVETERELVAAAG
jgi:hypothetical protein